MATYTTKDGDFWDAIAKELFGDETKSSALQQANLRHVGTFRFDSGVVLIVPDLGDGDGGGLPPWRAS